MNIVLTPVESLFPNDYNPNHMTESAFAELVAEVRHLSRIPKPVVVRRQGTGFVIVDGEHSWRAAREAGLTEVPCEVIDADDFEARRQAFKRNQHGEHNPVLLGRMFQQMMGARGLSQRALAEEIEVSEGTVRNALAYAEALYLRNSYAPGEDRREEIAGLSVRQVRRYVSTPKPIGDLWLDAGGRLEDFDNAMQCQVVFNGKRESMIFEEETLPDLVANGLSDAVSSRNFVRTMHAALRLWSWLDQHRRHIEDLGLYVSPIARLLSTWPGIDPEEFSNGFLPWTRDGTKGRVLIAPDKWALILQACSDKAENFTDFREMVKAALRIELGIDDRQLDFADPRELELYNKIKDAPDFIREADIPLLDKTIIANIAGGNTPEEKVMILEAKRRAVESLKAAAEARATYDKMIDEEMDADKAMQLCLQSTHLRHVSAVDAFNQELEEMVKSKQLEERNALLDSPDQLHEKTIECLNQNHSFRERTDKEALRDRLLALPWPERRFLCAYITGHPEPALSCWLKAVGPEESEDAPR